MKRLDDMAAWLEAVRDTPAQRGHPDQETAFTSGGSHVKSLERESPVGFPKYHGILVVYDRSGFNGSGFVLVRSIGSPVSPPGTLWAGTDAEYRAMWAVD